MADILISRTILFGGIDLKVDIEEMTEPTVKRKTVKITGGRHGSKERRVGIEPLSGAKLTINGAPSALLKTFGITAGEYIDVQILDSFEDESGAAFSVEHNWAGQLLTIQEKGAKKLGDDGAKSSRELEFMELVEASKVRDGSITEYNINVDTDVMDFGNGDEMEQHRRNTGQP